MDHCSDLTRAPGAPNQVRIPYLDALRCLAILLVIALHVTAPIMVSPTLAQTNTWLACMVLDPLVRVGVPLFLMISGCLMLDDPRLREITPFYKKQLPKLLIPLVGSTSPWPSSPAPSPSACRSFCSFFWARA